jgi:spore coat protein CotH
MAIRASGIVKWSDAFSCTCHPNINPHVVAYDTHLIMCLGWGLENAFMRQGDIASMTNKNVVIGVTLGRTAKGDELPTSPPVNEASGIWMLKPSLLRRNAKILSSKM